MKSKLYFILAAILALASVLATFSMLSIPGDLYHFQGQLKSVGEGQSDLYIELQGQPDTVYIIDQKLLELDGSFSSRILSLRPQKDSLNLQAFQGWTDKANSFQVIALKGNGESIFTRAQYKKASYNSAIFPAAIFLFCLFAMFFLWYITSRKHQIRGKQQDNLDMALRKHFEKVVRTAPYWVVRHRGHAFLLFHDFELKVQRFGNRNQLHWVLCSSSSRQDDITALIKRPNYHNLTTRRRLKKLEKAFDHAIDEAQEA